MHTYRFPFSLFQSELNGRCSRAHEDALDRPDDKLFVTRLATSNWETLTSTATAWFGMYPINNAISRTPGVVRHGTSAT